MQPPQRAKPLVAETPPPIAFKVKVHRMSNLRNMKAYYLQIKTNNLEARFSKQDSFQIHIIGVYFPESGRVS